MSSCAIWIIAFISVKLQSSLFFYLPTASHLAISFLSGESDEESLRVTAPSRTQDVFMLK